MVGDAADDALQEAALQAMLALDRLRQPTRFGAWLAGIALNVCRGMLEERSDVWSWDALVGGGHHPEPADPAADPARVAEQTDLAARVRAAVEALPRGQRAAVLLVYLAGLTHAETAALLGAPVGAVKTRLHKARARLRRELAMLWQEETMANDLVDVTVSEVQRRLGQGNLPETYRVILREAGGARELPIWVGRTEARAVVAKLEGIEAPRPQTDAFGLRLLEAAGGRPAEVRISRLADDVFYASAVVDGPRGRAEVDARPSDAINLALLAGAPIRVDRAVFEQFAGRDSSLDGDWTRAEGTPAVAAEIRRDLERWERMRLHGQDVRTRAERHRAAGHTLWRPEEHADRLSADARDLLVAAEGEARDLRHGYLGTEHLLLALLRLGYRPLVDRGATYEAARLALEARVEPGEKEVAGSVEPTPRVRLGLGRALDAAGAGEVGLDRLLWGMLEQDGLASGVLADIGIDPTALRGELAPAT
jgi:RNA polymerase sigma factor (sigma-70 family)